MTFSSAGREKKLNKGYKVEQIAGKVDYFVFYVDRSSLISGKRWRSVANGSPQRRSPPPVSLRVTPFSCFRLETLPENGMQIKHKGWGLFIGSGGRSLADVGLSRVMLWSGRCVLKYYRYHHPGGVGKTLCGWLMVALANSALQEVRVK